jgi:hypothetical protein
MNVKFNSLFFLKLFVKRHVFQLVGVITFFIWVGDIEWNMAGFIYLPLTFVLILLNIITTARVLDYKAYLA